MTFPAPDAQTSSGSCCRFLLKTTIKHALRASQLPPSRPIAFLPLETADRAFAGNQSRVWRSTSLVNHRSTLCRDGGVEKWTCCFNPGVGFVCTARLLLKMAALQTTLSPDLDQRVHFLRRSHLWLLLHGLLHTQGRITYIGKYLHQSRPFLST